jgi:hypothetical protein
MSFLSSSPLRSLFLSSLCLCASVVSSWGEEVFPGKRWAVRRPGEVGLDAKQLDAFKGLVGGRGCVVRNGYLVYTWGDAGKRGDVASACKPWYSHFLFKAIESGKLKGVDARVVDVEPRLAKTNAKLGFKDRGITWRNLACQTSCYGVTERPGEAFDYNDYNMALFFDTLFLGVYKSSYKKVDGDVLGPLLTGPLGCEDRPTFLAFGMKDRPGRLAISPRDFARFGLLYLHGGKWKGKALIDPRHVKTALGSPVPARVPRTRGKPAEMIRGQRTIGGGRNQTDHMGSYSFAWWTNGVDRAGKRHWPGAPRNTFAALGHGGKRGLVVMPGLGLVASWNDSRINSPEAEGRAFARLARAVRQDD